MPIALPIDPALPEIGGESLEAAAGPGRSTARDIAGLLAGLFAVIAGSRLLIFGASGIARTFGMSDWQIGVTIVAAGTSAPEVFTSLTAALKGRYGISAGGLIGSDIYNLLGVLGVAATISPMTVADNSRASVVLLVAMVAVVFLFLRTGWRVSRAEGVLLLLISGIRWWADIAGAQLLSLGN